jgi:trimeric autotransporter adhesin
MRRIWSVVVWNACAAVLMVGCDRGPVSPRSVLVSEASPASATVKAVRIGSVEAKALTPGSKVQLAAMAQRGDGIEEDVTGLAAWSSDNPLVATVSSSGLVSAEGPGTTIIRAAYQGSAGETVIVVDAPPPIASAPENTPSPTTPEPNPSPTPSPSPAPGEAPAPNPTGPAPTPAPGLVPSLPIPLPPTVQRVTISGGSTVPVGQSLQLRATAHMSDGTDRDVTSNAQWSTTNSSVASVSQSGVVTGSSLGPNVVTAQYNGATAAQPVQVTPF